MENIDMTALRENEFEYCREHPVWFVESHVRIENKEGDELIKAFKLWPMQKDVLNSICTHRQNIILKARQLGITWLALSEACRVLLCWKGRTVVAISRAEDEAKELVRRLAVILSHMPELIAEEGHVPGGWSGPTFKANSMDISIRFPNGPESTFKALLSSPSTGRGFTADLVIFDEWAFQQAAEEIWKSLFPTMNRAGSGRLIGLSTMKRGTLFEDLFTNEGNGFNKVFLPWYADPSRDKAWYDRTWAALGKDAVYQEYPETVEQALMVPGGQFFPEVKEETHVRSNDGFFDRPVTRYVAIDYGLDMLSAHWIAIDTRGRARVYREYDSPNLIIQQAAAAIREYSGNEDIQAVLAPDDLWSRSQETGRSRADIFAEAGVTLEKVSRNFEAGCSAMKSWLRVDEKGESYLTFEEGKAPNLMRCLTKITKDELRPDVYAKEPHSLTHDPDSLRYFCIWWTAPTVVDVEKDRVHWEPDQYEDYEAASPKERLYLLEKWGNPY